MKNYDPSPVHEWNHPSSPFVCYPDGQADGEPDPESVPKRFLPSEVNAGSFTGEGFGDPFRIPAFEQTDSSTDEMQENVMKE